ncbi:YeiH family protein [Methylobacterium nigriterrae]|uniref:YeiH family protein n=1 Tax=Methylobacterium nigriterrae TaxID=3127512 RepID=UPI003013A065
MPPIAQSRTASEFRRVSGVRAILPGLCLCLAVTASALGFEAAEAQLFGRAWLEALVLAILLGTAVRTAWTPSARFTRGIAFSAKTLLEVAVVLLGASLSFATILAAGPGLLVGIAAVVALAILASYGIGRMLGLHHRMAILVACGNSICGNSAIAAAAPVIGASGEDVAASIAFTAVLGVLVVLGLPLLVPLLGLSPMQYGVLAGLTVYAVPQVLAATAPVATLSMQVGTLVKLVRVLMLGPVILALSVGASRLREVPDESASKVTAGKRSSGGRIALHRFVPWFILGFLALAGLRSAGLIPGAALRPTAEIANVLTVISMVGLGLGVDVRVVAKAGLRVTLAVTASLLALGAVSLGLIHVLGVA